MGSNKTTTTSNNNSTTTPTATPEETQMNQLQLERTKSAQPGVLQADQSGLNLTNMLLTGQALPGYLGKLPGGIDEGTTQTLVNQSLKDVNAQLAKSGAGTFMESGASQAIGARTAADIRTQTAQFNHQQLMQLLNQAIGAPAQVQQPLGLANNQLSGRLAGLTSYNQTGGNSITQKSPNPFLQSFQNSGGTAFGNWVF